MDFSRIKRILLLTGKILCIVFAAFCLLCGMVPLVFFGHLNAGNITLLCYGLLLLCAIFIRGVRRNARLLPRLLYWARLVLAGILAVCFLTGAVISCFMIRYAFYNEPPAADGDGGGTVIVLGCQIYGETPSVSLKGRLDAAYAYLVAHGDCAVIVAGGQGEDEAVSEAYAMQKYLVEHGISAERIYLEDRSVNTDENIRFSGALIREKNLPQAMYIVTDTFHCYRAYLFAERYGYEAYNLSADIYWPLLGEYWVRDLLGVLHMKLLSN